MDQQTTNDFILMTLVIGAAMIVLAAWSLHELFQRMRRAEAKIKLIILYFSVICEKLDSILKSSADRDNQ